MAMIIFADIYDILPYGKLYFLTSFSLEITKARSNEICKYCMHEIKPSRFKESCVLFLQARTTE
jgi:hypothetical protein